jgi:malonyl-CoA/methylmalonyl-CoA synthetase
MFMAVPTMYAKMLEHSECAQIDFSHLRLITSGSAPLLKKDFERIKETFGMEPVEREGMTETLMNFSNPIRGRHKPGSIGLPLPCFEVRIVDFEIFEDVPEGQVGEIWLKGPTITPGYWRKPEETERAFAQRWFRTGDLGRRDDDGYYYLTDQIKNIVISGERTSPRKKLRWSSTEMIRSLSHVCWEYRMRPGGRSSLPPWPANLSLRLFRKRSRYIARRTS